MKTLDWKLEMPKICPQCGELRKDYSTVFPADQGWRVRFRCGHYFTSAKPAVAVPEPEE